MGLLQWGLLQPTGKEARKVRGGVLRGEVKRMRDFPMRIIFINSAKIITCGAFERVAGKLAYRAQCLVVGKQ